MKGARQKGSGMGSAAKVGVKVSVLGPARSTATLADVGLHHIAEHLVILAHQLPKEQRLTRLRGLDAHHALHEAHNGIAHGDLAGRLELVRVDVHQLQQGRVRGDVWGHDRADLLYVWVCMHVHVLVCVCLCACIRAYVYACMRAYVYACMCACVRACMHACVYVCTS